MPKKVSHNGRMHCVRVLSFAGMLLLASTQDGLGAFSPALPPSHQTDGTTSSSDMLATEVVLNLVVNPLGHAPDDLRKMVRQQGGIVVEDIEEHEGSSSARFTIRIDSAATEALLAVLLGLGQLDERRVMVREVGKEFSDFESQQTALTTTLLRYEQLLARANGISDVLAIENERRRIQGEIEHGKANQRQLRDRVSRSFLYVKMSPVSGIGNPSKW